MGTFGQRYLQICFGNWLALLFTDPQK